MSGIEIAKKYLQGVNILDIHFEKPQATNGVDNRCLARIWGDGDYGNIQCSNIIQEECLCNKHYKASLRMGGKWWLGLVTEERPESPEHPISGKHKWKKDNNGNDYIINEVIIETKKVEGSVSKEKRPRGRPKGSKNKVK
tara:strand:+ start:58 stop:477 length:420 start_codon:yes stop_codon:yes gene_type:complete